MRKDHNRERKRSGCLQQIIVRKRHFPADEPSSGPFCRIFVLPGARHFLQDTLSQKRLLSCESDSYRKTEALRLAKILSAGNPVRKNASLRASDYPFVKMSVTIQTRSAPASACSSRPARRSVPADAWTER